MGTKGALWSDIDRALRDDSLTDEDRVHFRAADETTRRAVVGYLSVYAGPWGLKASEEDAVLGIVRALWGWPFTGESIERMRADKRFDVVADYLCEDGGMTPLVMLVACAVEMLRTILGAPDA